MNHYEFIEHTADIGVKLRAKDLPSLFCLAAKAMFDVLALRNEKIKGGALREVKIKLRAANLDDLLVRWLSELLFLSENKGIIFTKFSIEGLTEESIKATVAGPARVNFSLKREIKAVTYHELKVEHKNGQYRAQIIFDV